MKIVLCPDSFKGSLSALEVCEAMQRGALRVFPEAQIQQVPLADGGEGTLDALLTATSGTGKTMRVRGGSTPYSIEVPISPSIRKTLRVRGPLDEEIEASYGILPDGTAVIEMAQASGLNITPLEKRDALRASTLGTGQLIKSALDAGCREFLIGLGGSATTDGGTGALTALGARFFDEHDVILPVGGGALNDLAKIDLRFFDERLAKCKFIALCDVTNVLHGENGAAYVYAPQKGASKEQVEFLDAGLKKFADISAQTLGFDRRNEAGSGAAGGIGFGLMAFLKAQMSPGIETVLKATNFDSQIEDADLILTGEGALDAQTLSGKTIAGVCQSAKAKNVPVVAIGGKVALNDAQMDELGLQSAFSIVDAPRDLEYCLQNAAMLIENTIERIMRLKK